MAHRSGLRFAHGQARWRELLPQAHGRVLEIGLGTGRNLPFYDRQRITQLVGVDPAVHMHTLVRRRSARAGLDVELVGLSAEKLPLPSDSFDTVVCTYTLCSIADPAAALSEVARVLKPGGQLMFCEHGLSPQPSVTRWQARIEPLWKAMVGGCHLTRNVPRLLAYHFWGHACKA